MRDHARNRIKKMIESKLWQACESRELSWLKAIKVYPAVSLNSIKRAYVERRNCCIYHKKMPMSEKEKDFCSALLSTFKQIETLTFGHFSTSTFEDQECRFDGFAESIFSSHTTLKQILLVDKIISR